MQSVGRYLKLLNNHKFIFKANAAEIISKNCQDQIKYRMILQPVTSFLDYEIQCGNGFKRKWITVSKKNE